jgi:hypothetical protein
VARAPCPLHDRPAFAFGLACALAWSLAMLFGAGLRRPLPGPAAVADAPLTVGHTAAGDVWG